MKVHPVGTTLGERYEVTGAPLGIGSFGAVYPVIHKISRDRFALKLLHEHLAKTPARVDSFLEEVRRPASFRNTPGTFGRFPSKRVVKVTDAGVDKALGAPFMVMEFLEGEGFDKRLDAVTTMHPMELLELMRDLACVLDEAHSGESHDGQSPIIHRDLKPENLFIARDEGDRKLLKVLDFGIAKAINAGDRHGSQVTGTALYMAPEQFDTTRELGPYTDVWALGLIVFCALAGGVFWKVDHWMQVIPKVLAGPIPTASERAKELGVKLPAEFDAWFAQCVVIDPSQRFKSAGAAVKALEDVVGAWPEIHTKTSPEIPRTLTRPPEPPPPPGVGLDLRLRNKGAMPLDEARDVLREVALKLDDARSPADVSLVLTPERVRLVKGPDGDDIELWEVQPRAPSSGERRGTHTIVARFGVADFACFAPETLRSQKGSAMADVWSLALLAFEVMTGYRFWPQETIAELLRAIESGVVPTPSERLAELKSPPSLPAGFDQWFARCTAREPTARYKTPTRAMFEFDKLVRGPRRSLRRKELLVAGVGVVIVATIVVALGTSSGRAVPDGGPPIADATPVPPPPPPPPTVDAGSDWRGENLGENPFVPISDVGRVLQHEVSRREYARWSRVAPTGDASLPMSNLSWDDANRYCTELQDGATLPPKALWMVLRRRDPQWVQRVRFPQGDGARPWGLDARSDVFESVYDLIGNVAEWSSEPSATPGEHTAMGARWNVRDPSDAERLMTEGEVIPRGTQDDTIGFRCAVPR